MSKPGMSNIPGVGAMADTFDFVKNMWSSMGMKIPGMAMPSLSVEEVDKQIKDLKAVESWLTLNMNMLRGTIQALEVQSATLSALQAMGETMSQAVKSSAAAASAPTDTAEKSSAFSFSHKGTQPEPELPDDADMPDDAPEDTAPEARSQASAGMAPLANPAAWWTMLQDQFKQAVSTAMQPEPKVEPVAPPVASSEPASEPVAPKPRKRKAPAKPASS
jgi:hypothetical protein